MAPKDFVSIRDELFAVTPLESLEASPCSPSLWQSRLRESSCEEGVDEIGIWHVPRTGIFKPFPSEENVVRFSILEAMEGCHPLDETLDDSSMV